MSRRPQRLYSGMNTATSLPDELFASAEALAERLGVSRSALFATAVAEFLAKHQARTVTDRLTGLYAEEPGTLDPRRARAQARSVARAEWESNADPSGGLISPSRAARSPSSHGRCSSCQPIPSIAVASRPSSPSSSRPTSAWSLPPVTCSFPPRPPDARRTRSRTLLTSPNLLVQLENHFTPRGAASGGPAGGAAPRSRTPAAGSRARCGAAPH